MAFRSGKDWHLIGPKSVCCKACHDGRNFPITERSGPHAQPKNGRMKSVWCSRLTTSSTNNIYLYCFPCLQHANTPNNIDFVFCSRPEHDVCASRSKSITLFALTSQRSTVHSAALFGALRCLARHLAWATTTTAITKAELIKIFRNWLALLRTSYMCDDGKMDGLMGSTY